jgi:hypothetical protein
LLVPNVTFECSITCTEAAHIWLDGTEVPLDESGLTKTGQLTLTVGDSVHIRAQLEGVKGSAWSLDITPVCPNTQPAKLWSRNGVFEKGGLVLSGDATVPANPCASKDGLELAKVILPDKAKAQTTTAKKAAKKGAAKSGKKTT